jgi:hypothetical protein
MRDIQIKVYRPVALPQKFFGAPDLPGLLSFCVWVFVLMGMAAFYFPFPPLAIILLVVSHVALMMWGAREPHMSFLMQTIRKAQMKPRTMGRRSRQHTFLP